MRTLRICAFIFLAALLFSCGGHNAARDGSAGVGGAGVSPVISDHPQTLGDALAQLDALPVPDGVKPEVFLQLKAALREALECRAGACTAPMDIAGDSDNGGVQAPALHRIVSTPPTGDANAIPDLAYTDNGDATMTLVWSYYNVGDYNQDGIVGIADITPLAMHFGETVPAEDIARNSIQAVIDGSGDGAVNIADVTPIAMNFGVEVVAYRIQTSSSQDGPYTSTQAITLDAGVDESVQRMHFTASLSPTQGYYYRVVPIDSDSIEGEPSNSILVVVSAWTHTWTTGKRESAHGVCLDSSGNIFVAGSTWVGMDDIFLLKYSPEGSLLWQKTWGETGSEGASALGLDSNGDVYIAGATDSFGTGDSDVLLLKYSTDGDLLWQKTWGGYYRDSANAISIGIDGSIYVVGYGWGYGAIVLKYSTDGNLLWQKSYGSSQFGAAKAVSVDENGILYVAGSTQEFGVGSYDVFVLKYLSDGTLSWQKAWGGDDEERVCNLAVDGNGDVYITGWTDSFTSTSTDAFLLKYSLDGTLLWQQVWSGDHGDYISALSIDGSGFVYASGVTSSSIDGLTGAFLLKYSPNGLLSWQKAWFNSDQSTFLGMCMDSSGLLYLAGSSKSVQGLWTSPGGIDVSSEGIETIPSGYEDTPSLIEGSASGIDLSPNGAQDEGGAFLMKIDPGYW